MAYPIENKLVIAVSSSALFDLRASDEVFQKEGADNYRKYTLKMENVPFEKGPAFSFIKRLLDLNSPGDGFEPIEVLLISKNDADTGNRVLRSLQHYKLPVLRSAFTCGRDPYPYISALNASLFLSTDERDVMNAINHQKPAGAILFSEQTESSSEPEDRELKIAFDFDGILADDSAERIYQASGLQSFQDHEKTHSSNPLQPGPLWPLFHKISGIQKMETGKQSRNPEYNPRIRTALITSRGAPADERVVQSLRHWGIQVNEAFFLGGISKERILSVFRPHIFFDDQRDNLPRPTISMAMVHVPYGDLNKGSSD